MAVLGCALEHNTNQIETKLRLSYITTSSLLRCGSWLNAEYKQTLRVPVWHLHSQLPSRRTFAPPPIYNYNPNSNHHHLSLNYLYAHMQTDYQGTLRGTKWGTEGLWLQKAFKEFSKLWKSNWCRRIPYISTTGGFMNGRRSIQIRIEVDVLDYVMGEVLLIECEDKQ